MTEYPGVRRVWSPANWAKNSLWSQERADTWETPGEVGKQEVVENLRPVPKGQEKEPGVGKTIPGRRTEGETGRKRGVTDEQIKPGGCCCQGKEISQ